MSDAIGAIHAADNVLEFQTLLSELSSRFINLPAGEVDSEIQISLRRVCELLGIDYAVLWQWSGTAPAVITPTHVYATEERLRITEPLRQEQYPWAVREALAGRLVRLSSLEAAPAEATLDVQYARQLGIKSTLCLPLALGGEPPVGVLALNTLRSERGWTDAEVRRLQLVSQLFTNALARRRNELRLLKTSSQLKAAADLAGLAFYEVDFVNGSAQIDDQLRHLCGTPADREEGLDVLEFWKEQLHPDDRDRVLELRRQLHEGELEQLSEKYRFLHPVDGLKWIEHVARIASRDAAGRAIKAYGVLRDITKDMQVENEMRDLSRRLIKAHEEERALLARELHDDVTQRLAVLAIDVGRAELGAKDPVQAESMKAVGGALVRLSEDIHSLAYQLHPSVLQELGLIEALRVECERRTRQNQIHLSVNLDSLPSDVAKDTALCLFRVAQEALSNVVRHSGARTASVTLRQMEAGLLLAVHDDGLGFDPNQLAARMHLGLASMRERVRLVGGTLDIDSAKGQGTTVVAWIPADEAAK